MDMDLEEEDVVELEPVQKVTKAEMQDVCHILEAASLKSNLAEANSMRQALRKFRGKLLKHKMRTARQTTMEGFLKLREALST